MLASYIRIHTGCHCENSDHLQSEYSHEVWRTWAGLFDSSEDSWKSVILKTEPSEMDSCNINNIGLYYYQCIGWVDPKHVRNKRSHGKDIMTSAFECFSLFVSSSCVRSGFNPYVTVQCINIQRQMFPFQSTGLLTEEGHRKKTHFKETARVIISLVIWLQRLEHCLKRSHRELQKRRSFPGAVLVWAPRTIFPGWWTSSTNSNH
jgi:hypothetical protein